MARYPPGPRRGFPGRFLFTRQRDPLKFFTNLVRKYGDLVYVPLGGMQLYVVTHPDDIEDVLVTNARKFGKGRALQRSKRLLGEGLLTSEGALHLRQRRLMQPAFHRQRIAGYGETMVRRADAAAVEWQDGDTIDVASAMAQLTLTIVGDTLLGVDVSAQTGDARGALAAAVDMFNLSLLPGFKLIQRLPLPINRRFERGRSQLDHIIYGVIADRRARGPGDDLLSWLIEAEDPDHPGERMSDVQLRDEALTLFLAGHETTANALTWTWYLLAKHPDVEARLHAEIDRALAGRLPRADTAASLPYTRMVFAESLRLYPPAWIVGRRALEPHTLRGFDLAPGAIVVMPQYLVHRDPRFWDEPARFLPERWDPAAPIPARPKFAYFPFGGGNRVCIGEAFAWLEGVLVLATFAARWKLSLVSDAPVQPDPRITLRPKGEVRMRLIQRARP
jgi:cytochrome P450